MIYFYIKKKYSHLGHFKVYFLFDVWRAAGQLVALTWENNYNNIIIIIIIINIIVTEIFDQSEGSILVQIVLHHLPDWFHYELNWIH